MQYGSRDNCEQRFIGYNPSEKEAKPLCLIGVWLPAYLLVCLFSSLLSLQACVLLIIAGCDLLEALWLLTAGAGIS